LARKGISSLLVALFERIIPERYLKRYELYIYSAGINFLATEYLVVSFLLGVIAGLGVSLLTNGLYGVLAFLVGFLGMAFVYPYWRTSKRIEDMERNLPDAFFYLASSLRAGISFSEALEELTTAKFGALTEEFKKTVAEIKKGRSTVDALRAFAIRNRKSQVIYRSMMIIIEALERGAPMSDVLVFVGNDVREILRIKQERKASTGMQAMFFIVTSGFVGPMILGIVTKVMESMSGPGTGVNLPVASMTNILFIFVIIQALVSGLGIGVIREGSYNAGLKYAALLVAMSSVIFKGATLINIGF